MRKLIGGNYYEGERKLMQKELDDYIDILSKYPVFKDKLYYEFKNSEEVINSDKILTEEEYINYQSISNHLLYKLNSN